MDCSKDNKSPRMPWLDCKLVFEIRDRLVVVPLFELRQASHPEPKGHRLIAWAQPHRVESVLQAFSGMTAHCHRAPELRIRWRIARIDLDFALQPLGRGLRASARNVEQLPSAGKVRPRRDVPR
jgi:hypothetical protein